MEREIKIKIDSKDSSLSYIRLTDHPSVKSIIIDPEELGESFKGELVLDIDEKGKIVGIEIIGDVIPDELK